MRLHVVGLPHTETIAGYDYCAYTAKIRRLGGMLHAHDHEMVLYAGTRNEATCLEHVPVVVRADWYRWWDGPWPRHKVFDQWDATLPCWRSMNRTVITEIESRIRPGDAVGIIAGLCQDDIAAHFHRAGYLIIEPGVGYGGVLDYSHRAFESHAWRHYVYGQRGTDDGRFFDAVIPNAYDPAEFTPRTDHDGYLLFVGRPTERKGLAVVRALAEHHRVVTAGQGPPWCPNAEHAGLVLGAEKAALFAGAKALLAPTTYLEPFGGVAVEAQMSGTPALATPFGAFPETIDDGTTGFLCATLGEFFDAVDHVDSLDRAQIAARATARFSTETVGGLYDAWLARLDLLHGDGWYGGSPNGTGVTAKLTA